MLLLGSSSSRLLVGSSSSRRLLGSSRCRLLLGNIGLPSFNLLDVVSGSDLAVSWFHWMKVDSDTGRKCWSMLEV